MVNGSALCPKERKLSKLDDLESRSDWMLFTQLGTWKHPVITRYYVRVRNHRSTQR